MKRTWRREQRGVEVEPINWKRMFIAIAIMLGLIVAFILFLSPVFMGDPVRTPFES